MPEALCQELRQYVSLIDDAVTHQLGVVNDLLDIARAQNQTLVNSVRSVNVSELLRRCLGWFHPMAKTRSIDYQLIIRKLPEVLVDERKLERVILNLVGNAFKFTPAGGVVRCEAAMKSEDKVLVFSVADSGPGIPVEEREIIFDRFRQGQARADGAWSGSGLGLAIVRTYVEAMGGSIHVGESAWGGALFELEIPVRSGNVESGKIDVDAVGLTFRPLFNEVINVQPAAPGDELPADDGRPLVMVADDHAAIRFFIREALAREFQVIEADNGETALRLARRLGSKISLLIADLMMPIVGGEQLIKDVRGYPGLAQVPILVLTAREDDRIRSYLLSDWVQDYVVKPFSPAELIARARNLVQLHRSRVALQCELDSQASDLAKLADQLIQSRRALLNNVQALQLSESRWRTLFMYSPALIVLLTPTGRIVASNPTWCELVGLRPSECRGRYLQTWLLPAERRVLDEWLDRLEAGVVDSPAAELTVVGRDGNHYVCTVTMANLPQSRRRYVLLVGVDVTAHRQAERELEHTRAQMLRLTRSGIANALTSAIAHEINQPLTSLVADACAAERWLQHGQTEEVRAICARMVGEARRAADVVRRVRALLSDQPPECTWTPLAMVLRSVATLTAPRLRASHVELQWSVPTDGGGIDVWVDSQQIQLVLLNLVYNAIEAQVTDREGPRTRHVWIDAELLTPNLARIRVVDDGPGVDEVKARRIFEPFFSDKPHGMGLGLALAQTIVQRHGGDLWLERGSPGATFCLTLRARPLRDATWEQTA